MQRQVAISGMHRSEAPLVPRPNSRQRGARCALLALCTLNLFNYASRYVLAAVKENLKFDLQLTDTQTSLPATGMLFVYMVAAVFFGWLTDKTTLDRRFILAGAVVFWSLATAVAGASKNIQQLVLYRSLVGIGEAAFTTIAFPMISDYYPKHERNAAYAIFSIAIPVGGATGFVLGAGIGAEFGWRLAFVVCGLPGFALVFLLMMCKDPPRGINDIDKEAAAGKSQTISYDEQQPLIEQEQLRSSSWRELQCILSNRYFVAATAGLVANSFAVGGFADWYESFTVRYEDTDVGMAGLLLGAGTVVGGIVGTLLGATTAQQCEKTCKNAYFLVPALFTLPGAAFAFLAVNIIHLEHLAFLCLLCTEICFFTFMAPINTISVTVIPVALRARSAGLQIFISHILGDVISPPIVGRISDTTNSLRSGMQTLWVAVLLSGVFWYLGYACLPAMASFNSSDDQGSSEVSMSSLLQPDDNNVDNAQHAH